MKANKLDKEIGEQIQIYRKLKNKTQHWLAKKLELSYQQVQNYERGKHRVSASCLFKIATILKTPIINFFPVENAKKTSK